MKLHNRLAFGFTLIELVMVILIIGILSITVAPNFFHASETEPVTVRDRIVSYLRLSQLRSMQQLTICNRVQFKQGTIGIEHNVDANCGNSPREEDLFTFDNVSIKVNGNQLAQFFIAFDNQGRSVTTKGGAAVGYCNACEIEVVGSQTETIVINSQGYIYVKS